MALLLMCSCGAATSPTPTPAAADATPAGPKGPVNIATFTGNTAAQTSTFLVDAAAWSLQYSTASSDCTSAALLILVFDNSHPEAFVRNIPVAGCTNGTATVAFGPSTFFLKITVSNPTVSYSLNVSEVR